MPRGLRILKIPLFSTIVSSSKKIEITGAIESLPGILNQIDVKIAKEMLKIKALRKIFSKSLIRRYAIKIDIKKYITQKKIIKILI